MSKNQAVQQSDGRSVLDVNADYSAWSREVEEEGSKIREMAALGSHFKGVRIF